MRFASFLKRFFAWVIDQFAMFVLAMIIIMVLGGLLFLVGQFESDVFSVLAGLLACVVFGMFFVFQFIYFGYFWSRNGQSLGMKLLNIKVVRRSTGELNFWRAALRGSVGYYLSSLIFGLGFIWAAIDENKQAWHDMIFDTLVIES